ncbi:polysaccharide deacetylase family protein [Caminibacter mediatlanticus]|uniref:Polysaccharide deacetylase n=1 Tax=Caminibacter mediatlanticus TB-2 TaxID=391592 RepID=A0AAI9AHE7_9BACT|nr:polysaccharide deacetylase family protein [Caminibacter mediatlanticus]EDM23682.1 polysaccharide deacetylase [Caminibacter mediatlanticus TB-2]
MKKFLFFLFPLFLFAGAHIFVLHRIDDFRYPYTNTSSKELKKYFDYLKENKYKVVKLSTLIKMIKNKEDINKIVVFTIDDNYKSFYKNGLPLFKKYNFPFTLFVYTKATTQKWGDFMRWNEVKECAKYGELGVHSYAHPHLAKLSNEEIINDTKKAISEFKKHIGFVPNIYSYPYGEYNERVKKIIKKFFSYIANQNPGAIDLTTPLDDIDRIALTGKVNIEKKLKLKRLHLKKLVIKRDKNRIIEISGELKESLPYVNIYITKHGWRGIRVKNKKFIYYPNFELKKYRNRVIIRYNYKIISKLILKEE